MIKQLLLTSLFLLMVTIAYAEEIALYNASGEPTAYIDASQSDLPIFMYDGTPVAYLKTASGNYYHIYGFNGKHLGWLEDGRILDHKGYVAGFLKGGMTKYTRSEPYKYCKKYKPAKAYAQTAPYKPYSKHSFGNTSLSLLLLSGRK